MLPPSPASADVPTVVRPLAPALWDSFIAHHPAALLYHTTDWLDLLAATYQIRWHPLGLWEGDHMIGVFPLQTRRLGPFRLAGSPLMQTIASTPYLGPLLSGGRMADAVVALEGFLRAQGIDHVEIAFPGPLDDLAPIVRLGYTAETCRTVVVPLAEQTPAQIWRRCSSACRRAVRKAEASGVEIVEAENLDFLDAYDLMCQAVYRGTGRPPHLAKQFYAAAWETLARKGRIKVFLAQHAGAPIAGGIFLVYQGVISYLSGASFDHAQPLRPNNLIQWHAIRWALDQHCSLYDLGGAVVPGITRFKLGFGGEYLAYTRVYRARSPLAQIGRELYRLAIPWWRRAAQTRYLLRQSCSSRKRM